MNSMMIDAYRGAEDYFFKGVSLKQLNLDSGNIAYMTGVPVADLNILYIKDNVNNLNSDIKASKIFFDQNNLSFITIIPQKLCKPGVCKILKNNGYMKIEESISMALNLKNIITDRGTDFSNKSIILTNGNKLNEWMEPLISAFDSTIDISSAYAKRHEFALKNKFQFYHSSLYSEGRPVSSVTVSIHNKIARIDDVGTLLEYQGKGCATKLITYALSFSKKYGASYCFLESSDAAFSIYNKLGFEILFKNNIFSMKG